MTGRVVVGLAMLAVGVVFLLGELDVVAQPGAIVRAWWPLVFIVIGVGLAVEQRRVGAGPLVFLVIGAVLLAATTDLVALDARVVWPALLIVVGGWLILRPAARAARGGGDGRGFTAVFEDRTVRSVARPFEGASLTSVFGDVDLDLRDAEPDKGDMTIDVTSVFGEVDVTVPADWRVEVTAGGLFADVEHRPPQHPPERDAPLLHVRGFSLFGDVTVRQ